AAVAAALGPLLRRQAIVGDDVANADAPAGPQDAGNLAEHGALVGRQVDDAVADDDVDRRRGQRDGLDRAPDELDVLDAGVGGAARRLGLGVRLSGGGRAGGVRVAGADLVVDPVLVEHRGPPLGAATAG